MDVSEKRIWQVAAGDTNRNYTDLCLYWDVILNGPGSEGPWPECAEALRSGWELSPRKITDLRRFAEDMREDDLVVLRMGTTDVTRKRGQPLKKDKFNIWPNHLIQRILRQAQRR
jgi:hypothetical protein